MKSDFFLTIDFDGTVTDTDITDAILEEFAGPGWQEPEMQWEAGIIGSRECLTAQASLIGAPLSSILEYVDTFRICEDFPDLVRFLRNSGMPFCIISDGFKVVIERLLSNAGLYGIPIFANSLARDEHGLKVRYPYTFGNCPAGTCKCMVAEKSSRGIPFVHIGDGRSDFCIAQRAAHVFARGELTEFCRERRIPHIVFSDFKMVGNELKGLINYKDTYLERIVY